MKAPELKYYDQFKSALASYQISRRAKSALKDMKLVLLLAPSSGGRNTVIRHLLKSEKYHFVVSDTTRPPRVNDGLLEQDGVQYWFRSEEEMLADLENGEFLEAELLHEQQVSGISIRELEKAKKQGKVAITDVDLEGVHNVIKAKPDTLVIMLLPPSFDEWQHRMASRGRMSLHEQRRRLNTANKIFEDGLQHSYYRFVIAEDVQQSAEIIDALVAGGPNPHQDRGRSLIEHLIGALQARLQGF